MSKQEKFIENNRQMIYYTEWKTDIENPKGNVVLVHGMAEHVNRYSIFAESLLNNGYNVFGYDQRGHGYSAKTESDLGYIDKDTGWDTYIEDLKLIIDLVGKENPNDKLFLLGHSMGSFVARDFAVRNPELIDGLIVSGSTDMLLIDMLLGVTMAKIEQMIRGKNENAKNVDQFIGSRLNGKFKDTRTKFDWLSSNEENVDNYIKDPFCGFCPKTSFYLAFFKGLIKLHDPSTYSKISKNIPVLMLSGQQDPVTNMGLGTIRLFDKFKENGVSDIKMKIYPDMRHEIFNESGKSIVFHDVIDWIDIKANRKESGINNKSNVS